MDSNKKVCFCYSGEGARGSIQAGITKSLIDRGIKPDITIGVSSGSVCAASYSYLGPDYFLKIDDVEQLYDKDDTHMLIELIKIRGGLWT